MRLHSTTISWRGHAAIILGDSGRGKSGLALHMMALGCDLVADDQTELSIEAGKIIARCPDAIKGQIEARGFAILNAHSNPKAQIACAVDLNIDEEKRLPEEKFMTLCGVNVRVFHKCGIEVLPFAILQYLKMQSTLV